MNKPAHADNIDKAKGEQDGGEDLPASVIGQKKNTKLKLKNGDEMTEIFLPDDIKPG